MTIELKIKAKSLEDESKYIRKQERKLIHVSRKKVGGVPHLLNSANNLRIHRLFVVRTEARATHLARAFINGTPYKSVEFKCKKQFPLHDVERMISKYGKTGKTGETLKDAICEWAGLIEKSEAA